VTKYICDKIFTIPFSTGRLYAKLWKCALSRNVEEFFKNFLDQDPEADDFRNLISSSSLSTDKFLVKTSWSSQ